MFDHYLETTKPDNKRRVILTVAASVAISGTIVMVLFLWVAGKLQIAKVEPPTIDFIIVQMTAEEPPPPPPPPPPPAGSDVEEEEEDEDIPEEEDPIEEDLTQPDDVKDKIPDEKKGKTKAISGVPGGMPGGVPGGVPGGIPGGVPGGVPGGNPAIKTKSTETKQAAQKPLAAVMNQAIYAPDPNQKDFQQTKAARFDKRDGKNTTAFCIDTNGKVVDVKTKSKFPGDPQVDKIIRDTIKKWRFKPFIVGGKPIKMCTKRTFKLIFKK